MTTIGAYDAKTHLPRLLDEVADGASFVITKHGRPVARLVGVRGQATSELADAFKAVRAGKTLGISVREALEEGRR